MPLFVFACHEPRGSLYTYGTLDRTDTTRHKGFRRAARSARLLARFPASSSSSCRLPPPFGFSGPVSHLLHALRDLGRRRALDLPRTRLPPRVERALVRPLGLALEQVAGLPGEHLAVGVLLAHGGRDERALLAVGPRALGVDLFHVDPLLHLLRVPLGLVLLRRLGREHKRLLQLDRHVLDRRRAADPARERRQPRRPLRQVRPHRERVDLVGVQEVVPDVELVERQGHVKGSELRRLGPVWPAEGYDMIWSGSRGFIPISYSVTCRIFSGGEFFCSLTRRLVSFLYGTFLLLPRPLCLGMERFLKRLNTSKPRRRSCRSWKLESSKSRPGPPAGSETRRLKIRWEKEGPHYLRPDRGPA